MIIGKVDEHIEEKNGNKYLTFASTGKSKELLKKYAELWDVTKYQIKATSGGNPIEYQKNFMKIKFNSDNNLPLNKILKLHMLTVIVKSVFQENGKYYPQVFLDECLYDINYIFASVVNIYEFEWCCYCSCEQGWCNKYNDKFWLRKRLL